MKSAFLFLILVTVFSCAPSHFVKPLQKGEKALNAAVGGPLIGFANTVIPVPLSSLTAGYGIKEDLTGFATIHTTSLLFGLGHLELGLVKEVFPQKEWRPALCLTPQVDIVTDFQHAFKCWPVLELNARWKDRKKESFFYLGLSNWFELSSTRAGEEPQQHFWIFNPHIGRTFVRQKWDYTIEAKWLAPNIERLPNVVDYKGPGHMGAFGIYFGITRKLQK